MVCTTLFVRLRDPGEHALRARPRVVCHELAKNAGATAPDRGTGVVPAFCQRGTSAFCRIGPTKLWRTAGDGRQVGDMIRARIAYERRGGVGLRLLELDLGPAYGLTADLAHDVLLFALTAATKPVVVSAAGELYRIPRSRLRSVVVWNSETL
jgi:hypothetical protein